MNTVSNSDASARDWPWLIDNARTGSIDQSSGEVQNANRMDSMSRKIR